MKKLGACAFMTLVLACAAGPALRTFPLEDADAPAEVVWVELRSVEFEGVDSADLGPIRTLRIRLSPMQDGFVAGRKGLPVVALSIDDLGSGDERRVSGSVLQRLVETVAAYYSLSRRIGTKVDIRKADLNRMLAGDTTLVVRVRSPRRR